MNQSSAEEYIRALFRYVLDRKSTSDEEINYWTNEVVNGRSPGEVLRLFTTSEENVARQKAQQRFPTQYPNGHFYSPVVNTDDVKARSAKIFERDTLRSIELNVEWQLEQLQEISRYIGEMPFADEATPPYRYYFNNTSYAFGDASIYWGMIGHLRPSRIIEIGSGFTSALALDAIAHFGLSTKCTFIDPYPELLQKVAAPMDAKHEIVPDIVQNIDPAVVAELSENDLLFIDSSHVVKTGSDVYFEITELLPRVKKGVTVHFHDMFYPFEYPQQWVIDANYSWNELYFLQAFLMYNSAFEITYFNDFIAKKYGDRLRKILPKKISSRIELNPGGGLWLRRV